MGFFFYYTVFVHVGGEAFVQAAGAALIAVRLVDRARVFQLALCLARVDSVAVDAALEEARAACVQCPAWPRANMQISIGSLCIRQLFGSLLCV